MSANAERRSTARGRLVGAFVVVALLLAGLVSPASAHAPRLGFYQCYLYAAYISPTFIGTLILKPNLKYRVRGSQAIGKYAIPRHHRIKLKTGSWAGWRGVYERGSNGRFILTIYDEDNEYLATCAHD